jgi:hypothetical protein
VLPVLVAVAETLAVTLLLALVLPLAEAVCMTRGEGRNDGRNVATDRQRNARRTTLRPNAGMFGDGTARTAHAAHLR